MATKMDKPVTRVSLRKYRVTITGAFRDEHGGRNLVVTLDNDRIVMREQGRRTTYADSVANIFEYLVRRDKKVSRKTSSSDGTD
jgi:hypothetical protein